MTEMTDERTRLTRDDHEMIRSYKGEGAVEEYYETSECRMCRPEEGRVGEICEKKTAVSKTDCKFQIPTQQNDDFIPAKRPPPLLTPV